MPVFNVTIDDSSPLIQYDGWWTDSSHNDPKYVDYFDATFHPTQKTGGSSVGGTAMLAFKGSAVYLFGAKRSNHEGYTVVLDGQTTTGNGFSATDLFKQMLFSQTDLDLSQEHEISLSNTPSPSVNAYVDLDYVIITSGDGDDSTQSQDTVWDDDKAQYSSGWDTSPNGLEGNYYQKTMHRTNQANAQATVTFEGNAFAVYGTTSVNHGFFTVALDNSAPITLNGTIPSDQPAPRYQNLLYWVGGLSSGQHTVTVTNVDNNGLWLDLDKFVVSQWSQASTGSSGPTLPTASISNPGAAPVSSSASSSEQASLSHSTSGQTSSSTSNAETISSPRSHAGSTFSSDAGSTSSSSSSAKSTAFPTGLQEDGSSGNSHDSSHHSVTSAIIGGAVAGAVAVVLIALGLLLYFRRRRRRFDHAYSTSKRNFGGLRNGGESPAGSIEPCAPTTEMGILSHERTPSSHASLRAYSRLPDEPSAAVRISSTATSSLSRYMSLADPDQPATPVSVPSTEPEPIPEPRPGSAGSAHQDLPPPNYTQATAADIPSHDSLLPSALSPQPHEPLLPGQPGPQPPHRKS